MKISSLSVIEIPYGDLKWGTDPAKKRKGIYSDIQLWKKYRELDDYKLCGVYNKAGVPFTVNEIEYKQVAGEEIYLTLTRQVSDAVKQALDKKSAVLLAGGYCKDAVGVCGGIQRAIGSEKKVGIVYLDAHSDMAVPATTTTGILGGMPMAAILGIDLPQWRDAAGLTMPLDDRYVILSDFRESDYDDDGALATINKLNISWLKEDEFADHTKWQKAVDKLAACVDAIYLHIDADILNSRYAPNAACVSQNGGPDIHTVVRNIQTVMNTGKVIVYGTFGFYFDTDVPGQEMLTLSGLRCVGAGLESWRIMPQP